MAAKITPLLTADFINEAKKKFKFNQFKVEIENPAFHCFSRATSAILLVCCGLVTLQQLIGEHIRCVTPPKEDIRPEALHQYCFVMSTFTIPNLLNGTVGVDVAHPGVGPYDPEHDEAKYHAYYQWVPFVLFFQALFFLIPHHVWKAVEGGLLKAYCTLKLVDDHTFKHRFVIDETNGEIVEKKQKTLSKAAEYYIMHLNYNQRYAYMYVLAELLNFAIVVLNIYLTDAFLGYEFSTYGPEVVYFLSQDPENRVDPMAKVFPKVTKCKFHKYGPSGQLVNYDVMCVLALNIVNEKIYVFLWFWFIIVAIIGGLALVYRIIVICSSGVRDQLISHRVLDDDKDILHEICERLSYPDWFVLKRLGDNINRIRFGELCQSIHHYMLNGARSPFLTESTASSPIPYTKGEKEKLYPDPEADQELPLIKPS